MSIDNIISQAIAAALKELYGLEVYPESVQVQATRKGV